MKTTDSTDRILPAYITAGGKNLRGELIVPERASGLVVFVRVDGKYGDYPQDRKMAVMFAKHRLATLLIDLPGGDKPDITGLTGMLRDVVRWTRQESQVSHLPMGCFSTGIGVTVMLSLAAQPDKPIPVTVSCDGMLNLSPDNFPELAIPVLFIIGNDPAMKQATQSVFSKVKNPLTMNVIPHTSHVFKSARATEEASQLAALWFADHLMKAVKIG
ncbi:MAG: hypothetical protein IT558_04805 [Alphaproteobacteria bacterium]|nr:hypothetical protein [Alphaproteobacteria bacterium]